MVGIETLKYFYIKCNIQYYGIKNGWKTKIIININIYSLFGSYTNSS